MRRKIGPTPLQQLLRDAPGGPWGVRRLHRAGGPTPDTIQRVSETGRPMRRDSVERLARVLDLEVDVVARIVEETARIVRERL